MYKTVHYRYPDQTPVFPYPEKGKTTFYWSAGKLHNYYIRINMALDIETTRTEINGEYYSVPYIITIGLSAPGAPVRFIYQCRNWEDAQGLMDKISAFYNLGCKKWDKTNKCWVECETNNRRLLCWVHNLSYEFSFCRTELKFAKGEYDFFTKEPRKALSATLENGIELRDSEAMTNSSLAQLAKMYCTTQKMVNDLDYTVPRHTHTQLNAQELRYIDNDVLILLEFGDVYFTRMCKPLKRPPLTNTARLLLDVVEEAEASGVYREDITKIMPDVETLKRWQKYLFRGGYVHGNLFYLDAVERVYCRDITSSYPATMFGFDSYYPVDKFVNADVPHAWSYAEEPEIIKHHMSHYCVIYEITFYNVEAITDHSYESINRVIDWLPVEEDMKNKTRGIDNGRIHRAYYMRVMGTELDYEMYKLLYKWEAVEVHSFQISSRGQLPDFLLKCLAKNYKTKNKLKTMGLTNTTDYILSKINCNTFFGMLCKAIFEVNVGYNYDTQKWTDNTVPTEDIEKDIKKRWLAYQWGIWTCAHSRAKLIRMICKIEEAGGHVLYGDTDSCKYIPSGDGKTEKIFDDENQRIRELKKHSPLLEDPAFYGPLGKGLGEWDPEITDFENKPVLVPFKTLGAKRYLYHQPAGTWTYKNGEWLQEGVGWHLCVAGLPKCAVNKLPRKPFTFFSSSGFRFAGEDTGKLRPVYRDSPYEVTITDADGTTETIKANSGVSLVSTDFEITEKKLALLIMSKETLKKERRPYMYG